MTTPMFGSRSRLAWLLVAAVPLATGGGLLLWHADPDTWTSLPRLVRWRLAGDALLATTTWVILGAPVCGVVVGSRSASATHAGKGNPAWMVMRQLAALVGCFILGSVVVTIAGFGGAPRALQLVAASHATLATAALALVSLGAWCGRTWRDPLDAVAASVALAVVTSFGVLFAGRLVQDLSLGVTNLALLASPLVATAAAAEIDILRTDLFYQLSPLAHRRFDYPSWPAACASYLVVAALCVYGIARSDKSPRSVS